MITDPGRPKLWNDNSEEKSNKKNIYISKLKKDK